MTVKNIIQHFFLLIVTIILTGLSILSFPLNYLFKAYHYISTIWSKLLVWIAGIKIKTSGLSNIKPNTNYVIVSNHASHFDIPIILSTLKLDIKMMAKKELLYVPFLGCSLLAGDYIIIDRKDSKSALKGIRKAKKLEGRNSSILLFPEGTRTSDGKLGDFKRGAFLIARSLEIDILPISLYGSYEVMPKKDFTLKPGNVYMKIDKAINTKKLNKEESKNLTNNVRNVIKNNIKELKESAKKL